MHLKAEVLLVLLDHQTHLFLEEHAAVTLDSKPMLVELDVLPLLHQDKLLAQLSHLKVEVLLVLLDQSIHQFLEEHVAVSSASKPMLPEMDVLLLQEHQEFLAQLTLLKEEMDLVQLDPQTLSLITTTAAVSLDSEPMLQELHVSQHKRFYFFEEKSSHCIFFAIFFLIFCF
jgi:hypothetical protein